jgi:membrane fusion protein (multidrug efflux system)
MKRFIFICSLLSAIGMAHAETITDHPSVLVQTMPLSQRNLTSHVTGFGILTPEPDATYNLNFPIAGRVVQVLVNPGQYVAKGELLLTVSADPATSLNYNQAKNALAYARAELARQQKLLQQQLTTRSQLDNAAKNLKDAEDAMAIQKRLGAGITLNKLQATVAGIVTSVSAVPGDRFAAGTNLMQIAKVDSLRARLGVEPSDSYLLHAGLPVHLSSVLNDNQVADGEVVWVAGQINPKTQLVDVSVRIKAQGFAPGTRVRGEIIVNSEHQYAVLRQAVLRDDNGSYLFQVVDHVAHRINVTTGLEDKGWVAVQGKFLPAAPVVTLGNYELQDGAAVRVSTP